MAAEITIAREGGVTPINGISSRTRSFMTSTGNPIDAIIHRSVNLNSQYANTEPFHPSKTGARNEQEARNFERISRAARNMIRRNR